MLLIYATKQSRPRRTNLWKKKTK